jgi:hypothetical protein
MAFDSTLAHLARFFRSGNHGQRIDLDPSADPQDGGTANPAPNASPSAPVLSGQGLATSFAGVEAEAASEKPASSASHASVWQTMVGGKKGLKFDLIWDASVKHAPAAFRSAVIDAAKYYTRIFSNNETVKVRVGYGEVDGEKIPADDVASNIGNSYYNFTYSNVYYYLEKDANWSRDQGIADSWLPSPDKAFNLYNDYYFRVTYAQALAWGLKRPAGKVDGYLGLSSSLNYDFDPNGTIGKNQYDAVGAIEHELTEIMGRVGSCLSLRSPATGLGVFTPLDLFRYGDPGERETTDRLGYFSINGGDTELGLYNNAALNGGDVADWYPSIIGDSYGSGHPGHRGIVSAVDLVEDSVLGYRLTAAGLAATKTLHPVV